MNPFSYVAAKEPGSAIAALAANEGGGTACMIAGGTNLIDLMKQGVMHPTRLVDINALPMAAIEPMVDGGLRLGALARNSETAYHPDVRQSYPLVSAAILSGASPQLRNMASNGGNVLQRTRCQYFYDVAVACNKREPGSGCPAIGGLNRYHAILGASPGCIAVHPSDFCVALAALDATVVVQSAGEERRVAFADVHRLPGDRPHMDTTIASDELIVAIELPANSARFANHSAYIKIRDRASYAFALVSVAAGLDIGDDGRIESARVALGGVAHKPWRIEAAEELLQREMPNDEAYERCAARLLEGAVGQGQNDFKISMALRAIVRALQTAAAGTRIDTANPGRPDLAARE